MTNLHKLTARGEELDTFGDIDASLNYQVEDILDISKRKTNWTKTINIPGSPRNNRFFKSIYEVTVDNMDFNPNKKVEAKISIGDNDVFKGYMMLLRIHENNKEITYDVQISGSLGNIMDKLDEYELTQLDLSRFNHIRDREHIVKSWDYEVKDKGAYQTHLKQGMGYVYPYIVNGNSTDIAHDAYVYDLYPATYVKTIMDSLFEFAEMTYTSKFFESEYFKKLIMPRVGGIIEMSDEEYNSKSVLVGTSSNYTRISNFRTRASDWYHTWENNNKLGYNGPAFTRESGDVLDSGNDMTFRDETNQFANDVFTCGKNGRYDVSFDAKLFLRTIHSDPSFEMEFDSGQFEYRYQLRLQRAAGGTVIIDSSVDANDPNDVGGTRLFQPSDGKHLSPWTDLQTPLVCKLRADNIFLEAGDKVYVAIGFRYPGAVKWKGLQDNKHECTLVIKQTHDGSFSKFKVVPSSNESMGNEDINLSDMLPSGYKMKSFLLDIIKMFNLIVMPNPNIDGDLIIEPRNDFYRSKQKVLDWEGLKKLDNDRPVKKTPMSELDANAYLYTYAKDDDLYNKTYEQEFSKIYGENDISIVNDFSSKKNKVEIGFAATPNASAFIMDRVAPFFVDKDDESFAERKVKPRILFYDGLIDTDDYFRIVDYIDGPSSTFYKYPYTGMYDHPTLPTNSLEFGPSRKHYWQTPSISMNNLFEKFHKSTLLNIVDKNAMMFEGHFYLTPSDIADFDFRDIVFLQGAYWRVNTIDYNPSAEEAISKVVLYKIIDVDIISPFKVSIPTSTQGCPNDIVAVANPGLLKHGHRYKSISGQIITKDCCHSIGGNYIDGICYASKSVTGVGGVGGIISDTKPIIPFKPVGISNKNPVGGFIKDNNSIGTIGVKVTGKNNIIPRDAKVGLVIGDNNTVAPNVKDSIIIGSGLDVTESGAIYYGDMKINKDGNILIAKNAIIDGGKDEVFNFNKTNLIDIIDGGLDSVRNPGGASKARPIIDGGAEE